MPLLNETLAVLGCGSAPAEIALREALRFKTRRGSLIVHDCTGRAAMILCTANKMGLEKRRPVWVDLADRRHPVSLFQLRRSEHFRRIWRRVLRSVRDVAGASISEGSLDWAVEAAWRLSADGSVGLGALFRCLSSPETRRWFLQTGNEPSDLGKLLDTIAWSLSFAAVHGVSEGGNRGNVLEALRTPSILWLESAIEHFEPKEHLLVQVLVEAAVEDALRTMACRPEDWRDTMRGLTVLHLYPVSRVGIRLEEWVDTHQGMVRHVGVHRLEADRPLPPESLGWVQQSEFVWVTGPAAGLRQDCHGKWLSDTEIGRIGETVRNELWIRCNRSGKALVTRVRDLHASPALAGRLRARALRKRRTTPVDQVAAAVRTLANPPDAHRDLYAKLCEIETLRTGWLRVRESKARFGGVDGVSIASFSSRVEAELGALSAALLGGQYRCRPLRRVQIPKPGGGTRDLGIACIRDRVVHAACLTLIEPIFEPGFSRFSYAFRPGRGAHQAVAAARSMIASGRQWAVIADVRKCFDSIDHDVLIGLMARKVADSELLALIRQWLGTDVLEFRDLLPTEMGVPQGESVSPLLANIYLDPLDKYLEQIGAAFVRYADDFVSFTRSEEAAREACHRLADFLRDVLHLELKPAKTLWTPVAEGFDFLGFRITSDAITIKPERAETFLQYVSGLISELAACLDALDRAGQCLSRINSVIRGWRNYFLLPGEPALLAHMKELDCRIEQIAGIHLPGAFRENLAWLCRDRLSLVAEADRPAKQVSRAPDPGPGYPEASRDGPESHLPPGQDGFRFGKPGPPTNRDEDENEPPVGTTLEDGERLYVLTHGTYVAADKEDLILRKKRKEVYRRPIEKISLIYLQGFGINISVEAQVKLAGHDIPVVFAPPVGHPIAVVNPIETSRASIRRLQALRRDDPDVVKAGIRMIAAKISNQAAVLKYFAKYRKRTDPEAACAMMESAGKIRALSENASELDPGEAGIRGSLMGFEGHAAAIYWRQLSRLIPEAFGFDGRITLSAQDPVNQCLNYIYGLLYGEVWRAVVKAGLDPYFGLIHGSVRDQGSLVFDLIEEFRAPFGDRVVVSMLGRGFLPEPGRLGILGTRSKQQLVRGFTRRWTKLMTYRSQEIAPVGVLSMQTSRLADVFRHEGSYRPYRMRW